MDPSMFQVVSTGGAVVVLLWLCWAFMRGDIVPKSTHDATVTGYREQITELNAETIETAKEAKANVSALVDTQRALLEEQRRALEFLRTLSERSTPSGSGGGS
ncbi:MAG: hypothetical protein ACTHQE_07250 [Thermomicrobiales bacterium]